MKIFCVVGIRASGKTTTITQLITEMKRRGYSVGTIKTVFCPAFSIDNPKSNTARHKKAGASLVTAKGKRETAFIYPNALTNRDILAHYQHMDYVILEGDYMAPVPRFVAAHGEEDALPRINSHTMAIVGKAATGRDSLLHLPAFDATTNISGFMDFIESSLPDTPMNALDASLPQVEGISDDSYCRHNCHHHDKKCGPQVEVTIRGEKFSLTPAQEQQILAWQSAPGLG